MGKKTPLTKQVVATGGLVMALQFIWLCGVAAAMLHFDAKNLWTLYQGNPVQLAAGAVFMVVMYFLFSGYLLSWLLTYVVFLILRDWGPIVLGALLAVALILHLYIFKISFGLALSESIIVGAMFCALGSFAIPLAVFWLRRTTTTQSEAL